MHGKCVEERAYGPRDGLELHGGESAETATQLLNA
jgi:hypothetical protein